MTLGKYLVLVLSADAAIYAATKGRIHTEILPQADGPPTLPAIVFTETFGDDDVALDGPTGTRTRGVQVDAWATTRAAATQLGGLVRDLLHGHTGAAGGLDVQGAFLRSERWDTDTEAVPGQVLYRTSIDFDVTLSGPES